MKIWQRNDLSYVAGLRTEKPHKSDRESPGRVNTQVIC